MPKPRKSAARETRREKAIRGQNHDRLRASFETERPQPPSTGNKAPVKALNAAQRAYDAAMKSGDIVFGIGPAGTGKTWLAARRAAEAFDAKEISKIIVTRPAVEAGESLGFLPGELNEKYEPYFRPVRDALEEYFGRGHLEYLMRNGTIEARPLGLLRGATVKEAWLIADEMQNATPAQMKMLLTRIGEGAKFIINGDPKQSDLPAHQNSGLEDGARRLAGIEGCEIVRFTAADIVRHGLTQRIVEAYEKG